MSALRLLAELRRVALEALASRDSAFDGAAAELRALGELISIEPHHRGVATRWLDHAVQAAAAGPWVELAARFLDAQDQIRWTQTYPHLESSPAVDAWRENYSFCPLVGPSARAAPFASDRFLAGFTLQAPGVTYPGHHHAPAEIYGVIAGPIQWRLGQGEWTTRSPGDVIVHRPHELHAMRTMDDPALLWVMWSHGPDSHVYMPEFDPPGSRMDPILY